MSGMYVSNMYENAPEMKFEAIQSIPVVEAKEVEKVDRVEELSKLIWERESTNGKNNYTKCEAQGKINGIGYGIPGNGQYVCFNSHEEEMTALKGWITDKLARGMSEKQLLCLYSGNNYKECNQ